MIHLLFNGNGASSCLVFISLMSSLESIFYLKVTTLLSDRDDLILFVWHRMCDDQDKVLENGKEENSQCRATSALLSLHEYLNDPTNHLKKYEKEVERLLALVSRDFEQVFSWRITNLNVNIYAWNIVISFFFVKSLFPLKYVKVFLYVHMQSSWNVFCILWFIHTKCEWTWNLHFSVNE